MDPDRVDVGRWWQMQEAGTGLGRIVVDAGRFSQIGQGLVRCWQMDQDCVWLGRCWLMWEDRSDCVKDGGRLNRIVHINWVIGSDGGRCLQMSFDGERWLQIIVDGSYQLGQWVRWWQMSIDGLGWGNVVKGHSTKIQVPMGKDGG